MEVLTNENMYKRKTELLETGTSGKRTPETCILHVVGIEHGKFTSFRNVKGDPTEKLKNLHRIREQRLSEAHDSVHRMAEVCSLIPDTLEGLDLDIIGYHRKCYQRFNTHLDRLKGAALTEGSVSTKHHSPRKQGSSLSSPLFPEECIFCDRTEIKVRGKTQRPTMFTSWKHKDSAWQQIEAQALALGNSQLFRKVQGKDLHATEAKCHPYCRDHLRDEFKNFKRNEKKSLDIENLTLAAAYEDAFQAVLDMIHREVLSEKGIVPLPSLRLLFVQKLEEAGYPNAEYRSEKLLHRLQNHEIHHQILFTKVSEERGILLYYLIYSKTLTVEDGVKLAYRLGATDKVSDVALLLRSLIFKAQKDSSRLQWPPLPDELLVEYDKVLPNDLKRFLSLVISGDASTEKKREKNERLVLSIGQDICRAATDGEWKLPKHILLCTTMRHLFRSKQLITILNRLGHCEGYLFSLELETALTKAIEGTSTYLTPQILTGKSNVVFHSEWDNLNMIMTNIHGSNVVNMAGGIMIQESQPGHEKPMTRMLPEERRSKSRSLTADEMPETLPDFNIFTRVGPKFPPDACFTQPEQNEKHFADGMNMYYTWLLCRIIGGDGIQPVPAFGGFISATGEVPVQKSTIDYFTPINKPITEYSTVQELLRRSEVATEEVGQKFVINTFDLGVCMKALPIVWKYSDRYWNHIILIGPFHTGMNFIGMLTNHKCRGSGYSEILMEAQLVTSGCLSSVLSGKAYAKAVFCLKTVCEAMERLLVEQFLVQEDLSTLDPTALLDLVNLCSPENLENALSDDICQDLLRRYRMFEEKVQKGYLGKTAQFWTSFIHHCHILFLFQYAVKTNDLHLFHWCNELMAELFFAHDGPNYLR